MGPTVRCRINNTSLKERGSINPPFPSPAKLEPLTHDVMGKFNDLLKDFIESIPDSKLTGFSTQPGQIWKNSEFRLDMQGVRGI